MRALRHLTFEARLREIKNNRCVYLCLQFTKQIRNQDIIQLRHDFH